MAFQKGLVRLKGRIGDMSYVKTKDGYTAKEKVEISKLSRDSNVKFERTRENNAEFGNSGRAVSLLRSAFKLQTQYAKDPRLTSRLQKLMMKVVKSDPVSIRGQRNAANGDINHLQGFEFNNDATVGDILFAPHEATVDRVTGNMQVSIPSFVPSQRIIKPDGSTHCRIFSAASEINFEEGNYNTVDSDSGLLPVNSDPTAPITLSNMVTPNSTLPLFLVLGIQFSQVVNGKEYPFHAGQYNSLYIVKVDNA